MTEQRERLIVIALLVIAILGLVWLWQSLPWIEKEVDHGFQQEARSNPFLAAKLFLEEQGVSTETSRGLSRLDDLPDPVGSTLVLHSNEGMLAGARLEKLWQWVDDGGHLIINANTYTDEESGENRNQILNDLGLGLYPVDEGSRVRNATLRSIDNWFNQRQVDECPAKGKQLEVQINGDDKPLQLVSYPGAYLVPYEEDDIYSADNEDGSQLVRYQVGAGAVTVMTDLTMWTNRYIACYDNAYFLWYVMGEGETLILYHAVVPSLFGMVWQSASLGVILSFVFLFCWLWMRGRRFGPLLKTDYSQRRRLSEHLHASAMFAWRNKHIDTLIVELRQRIVSKAERHHAGFRSLPPLEQYALLGRLCRMSANQVEDAMTISNIDKPQQLTEIVQQLQQIRNRL